MTVFSVLLLIVDYQKLCFDNLFCSYSVLQRWIEDYVQQVADESASLPQEGKAMVALSISAMRRGREGCREVVDESFTLLQGLLERSSNDIGPTLNLRGA